MTEQQDTKNTRKIGAVGMAYLDALEKRQAKNAVNLITAMGKVAQASTLKAVA